MSIRDATPADLPAIRAVLDAAFGSTAEAELVTALTDANEVLVSLVAERGETLCGHVLFSRLVIETADNPVRGAALAPVAVLPGMQNQGIGSSLIRMGIDNCADQGVQVIVVLGHPVYYRRFGFSSKLAARLDAPYSGGAFMALELEPCLSGVDRGTVRYPVAFADLEE